MLAVTTEQESTKEDLLQALYFARNQVAEAERTKATCERRLMEFLEEIDEKSIESEQLHFTATVATRRTIGVANDDQFMAACTEIGILPKVKVTESIDSKWLSDLIGVHQGDFPGVEVKETQYVTVKGKAR